ncbi:MAG: outer membrane beta-barrel protein [Lutibacter sp.]|nr:outer membrane beta-barrel protein [Lutibacter sp.]
MNKFFLLAFLLVTTNVILAQTEQGKYVVSGATGLQFISSNIEYEYDGQSLGDITQTSFSFLPSIGYFVVDNLAIGLAANFTSVTQKDLGAKFTIKSTMILPSALYYFPVSGNLRPIVQVGAGFMSIVSEEDYDYQSYKDEASGLAVNFGGGAAYFINEFVSLNFGLSYTMANLKDSDDSDSVQKQGNFAGNVGLSVYF